MSYLKIKNIGLLDTKALTLIGASTKGDDSTKIGQFGSGNKYAISYLLRNKYELLIFSGKKRIDLKSKCVNYRGKTFNVLYVNGQSTSITTEMGKDWELWQAIREIYCNAIDEGESTFEEVEYPEPKEKETHFYIRLNKDLKDIIINFDSYFSFNKKVLFECNKGQILEKTGKSVNIYRKGIKCSLYHTNSLYDYNLKDIRIDENRIIQYDWESHEKIWDMIFQCNNEEVILKILTSGISNNFENNFSSACDIYSVNISNKFKEVIKSMKIAPENYSGFLKPDERSKFSIIPDKIYKEIKPMLRNDNLGQKFKYYKEGAYQQVEPTIEQSNAIDEALKFFKDCDFHIPYIIEVGIFTDKEILGCAYHDDKTIILSEVALEKGTKDIINTIIEEYIHLKYGCEDETRKFQTAIIGEFISYIESKNTRVL